MLDAIAFPIGYMLRFIYTHLAFGNYGVAIILLTVFLRLLLTPLTLKQYYASAKISEVQPRLKKIQKSYAHDKEKLGLETMKLYKEHNVNPAGSLFPMLIQMPMFFALYYVISQPLKYMVGKSPDDILRLYEMIPVTNRVANMRDLSIIGYFSKFPDRVAVAGDLLRSGDLINMDFFGVNLGAIPTYRYLEFMEAPMRTQNLLLLLIPLAAVVTTYVSVRYPLRQTTGATEDTTQGFAPGTMSLIAAAVTGMVAFSVPAGLGLYWTAGNMAQMLQNMTLNAFVSKRAPDKKKQRKCKTTKRICTSAQERN
ncbi:MAG: membrane protein insertase YidC [Selenomonadales bacterium]|jgi:YidC/Oxa1 family membrane protein insertase|nr:membrane protein insertase YidC [Selenomonadales bacterium]